MNLKAIQKDYEIRIISFICEYNWEDMDFPAGIKDWKRFEIKIKQLLLIFCKYHMMK